MVRICTGVVWVRSTWPPETKNVSCESRDGWSAAMRSASKQFHSVSTSGPSSIEKPSPAKKRAMSRCTRVSGCCAPRATGAPGRVTSSARSRSASAERAVLERALALGGEPLDLGRGAVQRLAGRRALGGAAARRSRAAVADTEPLRPRKRARVSRSCCSVAAPAKASRACAQSASSSSPFAAHAVRL